MKDNRLGVMVIFADEGIINSSDCYLAQSLSEVVKDLYIIINGSPLTDAVSKVKNITEHIYVRENSGYDCGAYKYVLENVIGWDIIHTYDELLLINDSCYGPIYPWEDVFGSMADKPYDFWGITEQPVVKRGRYSEAMIPYHVQSYFMVIRSRLLKSHEFMEYWQNVKISGGYEQVVDNFELTFTKFFNDFGYASGAYIDSKAFCTSIDETQAYVFFDSYRLVAEHRCPLIKKKVFLFPKEFVLDSNAGETARKTLDYIRDATDYDADLILEHLITKSDVLELKDALHLEYICSKDAAETEEHIRTDDIAVIIRLYSHSLFDKCCEYIDKISSVIKVYVVVSREHTADIKKRLIHENNIEVLEEDTEKPFSYRELYEHMEESYKYVCVIDEADRISLPEAANSYMDILWENSIGNEIFVQNIRNLFEKNPRLGFLTVPLSYMSDFFGKNFRNNGNGKPLFQTANAFWCRTCILQPLKTLSVLDGGTNLWFQSVPYWAKAKGYYSGEIMTEEYASVYITNYQNMLHGIIRNFLFEQGVEEFRTLFKINKKVLGFIQNYSKIYVYGVGQFGYHCICFLKENGINIDGVIVSDGMKYDEQFLGYPVYELSEMDLSDDIGILVALNEKNTSEVVRTLETGGFHNLINFSE